MDRIEDRKYTKGKFARVIERSVPCWRDRPDSEHEQAIIRLLVGIMAGLYLLVVMPAIFDDYRYFNVTASILALFFFGSFVILIWLLLKPGVSRIRRLAGSVVDIGASTAALLVNGTPAAPLVVVYLWVTFGNGFRFGRGYLLFSGVLSAVGFGVVIGYSHHWKVAPSITIAIALALIVLPAYVASLLKQLEKALVLSEVANAAKSNFLATMSHEIRTPLNGLIGILDLIKRTSLDKRQRRYVELLDTSSEWLMHVITDGLDYTKIEADELILDPKPVNLQKMLDRLALIYTEVASSKPAVFEARIDQDIPPVLVCDQFRLTQILNNLLNNGFKFTTEGFVRLCVDCISRTRESALLSFAVHDSGAGIQPERLKDIFKPFQQAHSSNAGGTGLGLAIADNLVSLMGGDLRVDSTVDQGSCFTFTLELPVAREEDVFDSSCKMGVLKWKRIPKILLAEDNEINREVAVKMLQSIGCDVAIAENGLIALEKFRQDTFDLILMDCQMPQMDGYTAAGEINGVAESGHKNVPIIALTAHVTQQDRQKCFDAGMVDYVGKPYSEEALKVILCKWLRDIVDSYELIDLDTDQLPGTQKDELISGVGDEQYRLSVHDLRNALLSIKVAAELSQDGDKLADDADTYLEHVRANAAKALEISRGL